MWWARSGGDEGGGVPLEEGAQMAAEVVGEEPQGAFEALVRSHDDGGLTAMTYKDAAGATIPHHANASDAVDRITSETSNAGTPSAYTYDTTSQVAVDRPEVPNGAGARGLARDRLSDGVECETQGFAGEVMMKCFPSALVHLVLAYVVISLAAGPIPTARGGGVKLTVEKEMDSEAGSIAIAASAHSPRLIQAVLPSFWPARFRVLKWKGDPEDASVRGKNVAYSADGKHLIVVDSTHLSVADSKLSKVIWRRPAEGVPDSFAHAGGVVAYTIREKGRLSACVAEMATGKMLAEYRTPAGFDLEVEQAGLLGDGTLVVSIAAGGERRGENKLVLRKPPYKVSDSSVDLDESPWLLAGSPDGKSIAMSGHKGEVWIRRLEAGAKTVEVARHKHRISCRRLLFSPDGKYVLSLCFGEAILADAGTGREVARFYPHDRGCIAAAFTHPDRFVTASAGDGIIKQWRIEQTPPKR